jgi:hypothetical protein
MLGLLVGCIALGMRGITTVGLKVSVFECGRCVTVKGKIKCTLVQALRLCTGRTAIRGVEV